MAGKNVSWLTPATENYKKVVAMRRAVREGSPLVDRGDKMRRLAMRDDWKIRVGAVPFPRRWRGSAKSFGRNNFHRVRSAIRPPVAPMVRGKTKESFSGDASRMVQHRSLSPSPIKYSAAHLDYFLCPSAADATAATLADQARFTSPGSSRPGREPDEAPARDAPGPFLTQRGFA